MRRRTPIIAAAAVVALVSIPLAAQAHDGSVQASCSGASIHLTNYPKNSTLTGTVDGKSFGLVTFGPTYDNTVAWDPTVNHSYDITVTSGEGDHRYDKHYSQEVTGCTSTPAPEPTSPASTSTPTPSTPVTPEPSETPTPPVTEPPTQPSSPTSPTVKPSTAPSKPSVNSTPTPTSSTTATDAPVAVPVVAPATFTG